ncbi:MAG: ATP-binding cassette domain-containing protein [Oligoflexia bacterium]|nr:ATP-binding cassette domain-containing protein [Oligoflexia bacterium]
MEIGKDSNEVSKETHKEIQKEIILSVKNVSKHYYGSQVLDNISFDLKKGVFCCLLGENGAGKSTLLNILMGQECLDHGEGEIMGVSLRHDLAMVKNSIGLVSEKISYDVSVLVGKFFEQYSKLFECWDQSLFLSLMKERKLDLTRSFGDYSRGQRMQTALIAALAIRPKLLLIDEVTSVLDIWARKFFIEIMKKFTREGGTVLITTNIISEIQYAVDQIILINKGVIQLQENISEIPSKFIKIRSVANIELPIFKDPSCFWSGENSDGSHSYIVPISVAQQYSIPDKIRDRRAVTLDELFIYFIKTGEKNIA